MQALGESKDLLPRLISFLTDFLNHGLPGCEMSDDPGTPALQRQRLPGVSTQVTQARLVLSRPLPLASLPGVPQAHQPTVAHGMGRWLDKDRGRQRLGTGRQARVCSFPLKRLIRCSFTSAFGNWTSGPGRASPETGESRLLRAPLQAQLWLSPSACSVRGSSSRGAAFRPSGAQPLVAGLLGHSESHTQQQEAGLGV